MTKTDINRPAVIGCPFGDWAGISEGAFEAHMRFWHEERPAERLRSTGPVVEDQHSAVTRKPVDR